MSSPAQDVRSGVARAERLRRARAISQRLWFAAPIGAAVCAGLAAGVRWAGWPLLLPLAAGGAGLAALAAIVFMSRRDHAVTDAAATEIDQRAALGGELRSASWFAAHDGRGDWVDFHLGRAAERLEGVDWTQLYPPVRAPRAQAATALLAIAALVLVLPVGGRAGLRATGSGPGAAGRRGLVDAAAALLSPELRKQIEELLRNAERGAAPGTAGALTAADVRDLLEKLAQAKDFKNAKDAKRGPDADAKQMGLAGKELKDLAERLKHAGEISSLSPEVRDALQDAAEKLAEMGESQPGSPKDPKDATGAANAQQGDAAQAQKGGNKYDDSSVKSVKDASAGGGIGVMMTATETPQDAQEAGLGPGGGPSPQRKFGGVMPDLGAALRKETVEAYQEDAGEKPTLDLRRKTEKGTATVGYVSTSPAAFDKGRATAPPAVPENRRAAVQTYFIRKQ